MRLNNYLEGGPYSYLTDRPSTIPRDAPLVVFDTRGIPEAKAAAALFVICEHVRTRIARTRREHLAGAGPRHAWAGRSFLVIDEAWKLIERPATGRWFNEFCRRSRHYALWLIAISQQLSDFDNEHGKALLANAAMRLFLRQEARELAYVKDALALSEEAIEAISQLQTVRGRYSTAYLMNGTRGQGVLQIVVGAREYWIATSDPARDEPVRQRALRASGNDPWQALELLADEGWQQGAGRGTRAAGVMQARVAIGLARSPRVRGALIAAGLLIVLMPVLVAGAVSGARGRTGRTRLRERTGSVRRACGRWFVRRRVRRAAGAHAGSLVRGGSHRVRRPRRSELRRLRVDRRPGAVIPAGAPGHASPSSPSSRATRQTAGASPSRTQTRSATCRT